MKKFFKILFTLILITGIGIGGYFAYNYFNVKEVIVKATETVNPFFENIGELAVTMNETYKVPVDTTMNFNNGNTSLFFKLQNLKGNDKGKYYFEDNIVYSKENVSSIKDDEIFQLLLKYLNVEYEDLVFLEGSENSKVSLIDSSWKVLNLKENDMITIVLKRTIDGSQAKGFEYLNEFGDNITINDNDYNDVSFRMKQSPNSVVFSLYGIDIESFQIKEIEETFSGEVLLFINESLNRFDSIKLDSFNKKEYSHVSGKYYINISGDYGGVMKKKEIVFLQDGSDKVVELEKEIDETTLDSLDLSEITEQ